MREKITIAETENHKNQMKIIVDEIKFAIEPMKYEILKHTAANLEIARTNMNKETQQKLENASLLLSVPGIIAGKMVD
jgi:hypothetical protein